MIKKILAYCLLGAALPAQSAITYTIDSAHSYVSSLAPIWTLAYTENHASLPGEAAIPPSNYWQLSWQYVRYSLSGSFDAEIVYSPYRPEIRRLQLSNVHLSTDAPSYAGFGLPAELSLFGNGVLYMSSVACYQDFFNIPAGDSWSCTGGNIGTTRVDSGSLSDTGISLAGGESWPFQILSPLVENPTMPPPVTDYTPAYGTFEYVIQSTAVPEPGTGLLILGGLGLSCLFSRRTPRLKSENGALAHSDTDNNLLLGAPY